MIQAVLRHLQPRPPPGPPAAAVGASAAALPRVVSAASLLPEPERSAAPGGLTSQERAFFRANGFLVKQGILDSELVARARDAVWAAAPR